MFSRFVNHASTNVCVSYLKCPKPLVSVTNNGTNIDGINAERDINSGVAAVVEWYRYRIVACLVTSSSPVPLKTRRVGKRCTLNLSRAETSSRWCGVVVRRGGVSSGVT
ncbi:uncharacterized protein TNCV_222481 [Trichonephila clavipes]|nr:uncharacterized protein TNCV_222481 [Trichonephila clavipes]